MTSVFVFACRRRKVEAQQDELKVSNHVLHFDTVRGWFDGQRFIVLSLLMRGTKWSITTKVHLNLCLIKAQTETLQKVGLGRIGLGRLGLGRIGHGMREKFFGTESYSLL
jgi:hypothetical protein